MARVSSRAAIASSMVLYLRFKMYLLFRSMRTNHLLFDAIHWIWWSRCLGSLGGLIGAPKDFARDPLDLKGTVDFFAGLDGILEVYLPLPSPLLTWRRREHLPSTGLFLFCHKRHEESRGPLRCHVRFHAEPQAYRRCW